MAESFLERAREQSVASAAALAADIEQMRAAATQAIADQRYAPAYRTERAAEIAAAMKDRVQSWHAERIQNIDAVVRTAEQHFQSVTAVDPQAMAARAAALTPVIQTAVTNPDGLLAALERHYDDPVSRRLLEDTATAVYDALPQGDGIATPQATFAQSYQDVQRRLADRKPPAEREAEAAVNQGRELAAYVGHVAHVCDVAATDVAALNPGNVTAQRDSRHADRIVLANTRHAIGMYERTHAPEPTSAA